MRVLKSANIYTKKFGIFLVCLIIVVLVIAEAVNRRSNAASSFFANYDSSSLNASESLGSAVASTDGTPGTIVSPGYDGSPGALQVINGQTVKYETASNLSNDKGKITLEYKTPSYLNGTLDRVDRWADFLDVDSVSGYVYFTDTSYDRVYKTKIDGTGWTTFGSLGAGTVQFNNPRGIDYDESTGYIYIADTSNNRIIKTKFDGAGWATLGGFNGPRGLYYDSASGFIYVADYSNNRIVKTRIDGTGWTTYGSVGSGVGQFTTPAGVDYDAPNDMLYITDYGNHRIVKTQMDGTGWTTYGALGVGVGQFNHPWDIDYNPNTQYIYISDLDNYRLVKTQIDGTGWTTLASLPGTPGGMYVNLTDNIVTFTDRYYGHLRTANIDTGVILTSIGMSIESSSNLYRASDVYYDAPSGYLYAMSKDFRRLTREKLDGTGWSGINLYSNFAGSYLFTELNGFDYDPATGFFYITEARQGKIIKMKFDGSEKTELSGFCGGGNGPWDVDYDSASGYLYVANGKYGSYCSEVIKTKIDGSGWTIFNNGFNSVPGVKYDSGSGYVYAVDRNNNRIAKFKNDGTDWSFLSVQAGGGGGTFSGPDDVDYDPASGFIYVANQTSNLLIKTKFDGTAWTSLAGFSQPVAVHYDSISEYLYVANYGGDNVIKTKIDGTGWTAIAGAEPREVLINSQGGELRLEVNPKTGRVYFWPSYVTKPGEVLASDPQFWVADTWHKIAVSYDQSTGQVSMNLDDIGSTAVTRNWNLPNYQTYFYVGSDPTNTFNAAGGPIDNVRILNISSDPDPPINPTATGKSAPGGVDITSGNWYNYQTTGPYFTLSGASDPGSGVAGYYVYFGPTPDAVPQTAGSWQTGVNYQNTSSLVNNTTYYLRVQTKDNEGNLSAAATLFTYKFDSSPPPVPEYVNVSPVGCSTSPTFTFTWPAVTDPETGSASYQYKRGSVGAINDTNLLTLTTTAYQEGDNVLYVRSKDAAGNTSDWQTGIYCSTGAAYVLEAPNVTAGPSSIRVTWISTKATTSYVQVYEGNTYISEQGHTSFSLSHDVTVVGLKPERTYRYKLVWSDSNGNLGESEWFETSTSAAPSVNSLSAQLISPTQVIVSWKTSIPATSVIEYGIGSFDQSIGMEGLGSEFSRQITDLAGGTAYQIRIKATSEDGFDFYAGDTFSTPPLPAISGLKFEPVISEAYAAMKVFWTTNVETTSSLFYGPRGQSKKEVSTSDMVKDHQLTISNLDDNADYEVYAQGTDQFGNVAKSDINTFKTALDSRPPIVSDLTIETKSQGVGDTSKAQLVISWRTDELSSSQVEFGEGVSSTSYTSKTQEDTALSNAHVVIISNLDSSKTYHLRAASKDKAGNIGYSEDNAVITRKAQESALNIIIKALQRAFSWINFFK